MPAGIKLAAVIAVSAIACTSVYGLAVSVPVLIAASVLARIRPRELFKGARPLFALSCAIVIVKTLLPFPSVNIAGLVEGLITALRLMVTFAAAALLFAVTTMRELRRSLAALELAVTKRLFRRRAGTAYCSLGICLMLGFIPRFFELWEMSGLACDARSCRRGPRRLFILIPLVTERMMETAADTAQAIQARGSLILYNTSLLADNNNK